LLDTGLGRERGSYNERIRVDKFDVWDFGFVLTTSSNGSAAGIYVCEKRAIGEVYMSISASGGGNKGLSPLPQSKAVYAESGHFGRVGFGVVVTNVMDCIRG
jgi:hypothetical protein